MRIRYTPECAECGIPPLNPIRGAGGVTLCAACIPVDRYSAALAVALCHADVYPPHYPAAKSAAVRATLAANVLAPAIARAAAPRRENANDPDSRSR